MLSLSPRHTDSILSPLPLPTDTAPQTPYSPLLHTDSILSPLPLPSSPHTPPTAPFFTSSFLFSVYSCHLSSPLLSTSPLLSSLPSLLSSPLHTPLPSSPPLPSLLSSPLLSSPL